MHLKSSAAFRHLSSVRHEGKVIVLGVTAPDPGKDTDSRILYTVRRDGFEERLSASAQSPDWENWRLLDLPGPTNKADTSVVARESKTLSIPSKTGEAPWITEARAIGNGVALFHRSIFDSRNLHADAPVQALSVLGHLYVFRAAKNGSVLVDRYVLDGLTNVLSRKFEVRFKRSGKRYEPLQPQIGADLVDAPDFRDIDGKPFYEPTTEVTLVNRIVGGRFAVVLAPTLQPAENVWHFFAATSAPHIECMSFAASEEGLFNVSDKGGEPGIVRRTLTIDKIDAPGTGVGSIAATRYDTQVKRKTKSGDEEVFRDKAFVMLAVNSAGATRGIATVSFAITGDGHLARISNAGATDTVLRADTTNVILRPSELDEVKPDTGSPLFPTGQISRWNRSTDGATELALEGAEAASLPAEGMIRIRGGGSYNGLFEARPVRLGAVGAPLATGAERLVLDTPLAGPLPAGANLTLQRSPAIIVPPFTVILSAAAATGSRELRIQRSFSTAAVGTPVDFPDGVAVDADAGEALGKWEALEAPRADGRQPLGEIAAVARAGAGIRLDIPSHKVASGTRVELAGATDLEGIYTYTRVDGNRIRLKRKWDPGTLLPASERVRNGLLFEKPGDGIELPGAEALNFTDALTFEVWVQTTTDGFLLSRFVPGQAWGADSKGIAVVNGRVAFIAGSQVRRGNTAINDGRFHHVAAVLKNVEGSIVCEFVVDGTMETLPGIPSVADDARQRVQLGMASAPTAGLPTQVTAGFSGTLFDARLWGKALTRTTIAANRDVELTGQEDGLAGSWRLSAIVEDDPLRVADFSLRRRDGIVRGGPISGQTILRRTPVSGKAVIGFSNQDFFAAVEGATYEESFEFQVDVTQEAPFSFEYKGKRDIDSEEVVIIPAGNPSFALARPGEPWILASCTFTVPEGVSLVRSFGIARLSGTWNTITIRRHRITELSRSVREQAASESVALASLSLQGASTTSAEMAALELTNARLTRHAQLLKSIDNKIQQLQRRYGHPLNYWCQIAQKTDGGEPKLLTLSGQLSMVAAVSEPTAETTFRFPRLTMTGAGPRINIQPELDKAGNCAFVSAQASSTTSVKTATGLDVNAAECPPLCLEAGGTEGLRGSLLLDPVGFETKLRADLRKEFAAQTGEVGRAMRTGPPITQRWDVITEADTSKLVDPVTGNLSASPALECRATFEFDAGSIEILGTENDVLVLQGTRREFTLLVPAIDLSEPQAGKEKEPGRPVDDFIREGLVRVKNQLEVALKEGRDLQLFPVSGRVAVDQQIEARKAEVAADLTTLRGQYLAQASRPTEARGETFTPSATPRVSGAFLSAAGISPAARLNLLETTSGHVEVTFAENDPITVSDHKGSSQTIQRARLRQFVMDTSTDMWRTDFLPRCLNLEAAHLALDNVTVGAEWSAELWFFTPLAPKPDSVFLKSEYRFIEFPEVAISAFNEDGDLRLGIKRLVSGPNPDIFDTTFDLSLSEAGWHHFAVATRAGRTRFYVDGSVVGQIAASVSGRILTIGNNIEGTAGIGKTADVRIWNAALSEEEIAVNSFVRPSGNEPGLLAWFPLDGDTDNNAAKSSATATLKRGTTDVTLMPVEPFPRQDFLRNVEGGDAASLVTGEYTTLGTDPDSGRTTAMMRRFYAWPAKGGIELHGQKRVEELELVWVSNAQFAPTLLGYIEGAPPVPSENLTVDPESYGGATSVALNQSTQVDFSWTRSKEVSQGANISLFLGIEVEQSVGVGLMARSLAVRSGVTGGLSFARAIQAESSVSASLMISTTDSLKLAGAVETEPRFPRLGARFIPKNIGYALVISSLADVYVTRLKKSRRMVDYAVLPVPDLPPQINTITFLINPGYVMNGTLDGLVGTSAADNLFYAHIPEMRSRRGSLHPASYLRLIEANALKSKIEKQDKDRESYFHNFDATLALTFTSQDEEVERRINEGDAPAVIEVERVETKGLKQPEASASGPDSKLDKLDRKLDVVKDDYRSQQSEAEAQAMKKNEEIADLISDPDKQQHALKSFQAWQQKLEALLARAGKRNIVNTYVWDADGGLRAETQEFASTVEHTIGSSISVEASGGIDFGLGILGPKVELNAAYQFSMTQTLSKNVATSRAMSMEVSTDGIESAGITGPNDDPLMPGEKVDRFRFSTFYLEGSTANFNDFFSYVVDPRWLASNDEEARALRQVRSGKANPAWRVLHRVTAIERPALMGFGRDVRAPRPAAETERIEDAVRALREENRELKEKMDQILDLFQKSLAAGN